MAGLRGGGLIGQIVGMTLVAVGTVLNLTGVGAPFGIPLTKIGIALSIASSIAVAMDPIKTDTASAVAASRHYGYAQYANPVGGDHPVPFVYGNPIVAAIITQAFITPQDTLNAAGRNIGAGSLGHKDQALTMMLVVGEGPHPKDWLEQVWINDQEMWSTVTGEQFAKGDGSTTTFTFPRKGVVLDSLKLYVDGTAKTKTDTTTGVTIKRYFVPANAARTAWTISDNKSGVEIDIDDATIGYDMPPAHSIRYRGTKLPHGLTYRLQTVRSNQIRVTFNRAIPGGIKPYLTYSYTSTAPNLEITQVDDETRVVFATAPSNGAILTYDAKIENFPGVKITTRRGEVGQAPVEGMDQVRNTYSVGEALDYGSGVSYTTTGECDDITLTLSALQGIIRHWTTDHNYKEGDLTVQVGVRYRKNGDSTWTQLTNADTGGTTFDLNGLSNDAKHWWIRLGDHLERGVKKGSVKQAVLTAFTRSRYDVEVTRLNTSVTSVDGQNRDDLTWTHVGEIQNEKLSYPSTCYAVMEAVGGERLNGSVPNVKFRVKGREVKDLDAGTTAYSRSPSYCIADFLTHSRGGGEAEARLISAEWIAWADWCATSITQDGTTEARCLFDAVLDVARSPEEWVFDLAPGAFGMPYRKGRNWGVWIDKAADVAKTYYYSGASANERSNSLSSSMESLARQPAEILVMFNDAEDRHESKQLLIPPVDRSKNRTRATVAAYGITRRSQAARYGFHVLRGMELMPRVEKFTALPDGILSDVGDVISVQSEIEGATTGKKWRVLEIGWDFDLKIVMMCREYSDTFYAMDPAKIASVPNNTVLQATKSQPSKATAVVQPLGSLSASSKSSTTFSKPTIKVTEQVADVYP